MTYQADEGSVQDSRPREGFEIRLPLVTYRLASADRDLVIGGNTYRASPITRSEIEKSKASENKEVTVTLPLSHPICQRYHQQGIPPRTVTVSVWRKQLRSGEAELQWTGFATSMSVDDDDILAHLLVPSRLGEAMQVGLPNITAGRECPHILYGPNCRADETLHRVITTATGVDGPFITLASIGGNPDAWASTGKLFHPASGDTVTIRSQVGTALEIQFPIAELQTGDAVHVFQGCRHTIEACLVDFDNKLNFGGRPQLPTHNPFVPTGLGVYSSE